MKEESGCLSVLGVRPPTWDESFVTVTELSRVFVVVGLGLDARAQFSLVSARTRAFRGSRPMVKNIPQERSSEGMCESPDQLWQRKVEQNLNLDAFVEHDPAARA